MWKNPNLRNFKTKDKIVSEWMQRNGEMNEKYKFLVRYSEKKTVTGT